MIVTVQRSTITVGDIIIDSYTGDEKDAAGYHINYLSGQGLAASIDLTGTTTRQNRLSKELRAMLGESFQVLKGVYHNKSGGCSYISLWTMEDAKKFWLYHSHKGNQKAASLLLGRKPKPVKTTNPKGFIYLIRNEGSGNLKIGFSANPCRRLAELQTSCDGDLSLLAFKPGKLEDEYSLHSKFKYAHIRNEWFKPATEIYLTFGLIKEIDLSCKDF